MVVKEIAPLDIGTGTKNGLKIYVDLFQDGSPYVLEEDIETHNTSVDNYVIITTPDGPPIAVSTHFFEISGGPGTDSMADFSAVLSNNRKGMHKLSDEDCQALEQILQQAAQYVDTQSIVNRTNEYFVSQNQ